MRFASWYVRVRGQLRVSVWCTLYSSLGFNFLGWLCGLVRCQWAPRGSEVGLCVCVVKADVTFERNGRRLGRRDATDGCVGGN